MKELNNAYMSEMSMQEMVCVDGGNFITWIKGGLISSVVFSIIDNFGDIREGLSDGYEGRKPRY